MTTEAISGGTSARPAALTGPRGPKPKHVTVGRIGVYAFLIMAAIFFLLPLWVMIVTSLKTLPEIREGHLFNWPALLTFDPWLKAWDTACTGRDCDGLKPGFWNSVKITALSVPVSIVIAMING